MLFADQVDHASERPREGTILASLYVGASLLFHPYQRLQVEYRGDEAFHVADTAAVDQVLEFLQGIEAVAGATDALQQVQDPFLGPTGPDCACRRLGLPPGCG